MFDEVYLRTYAELIPSENAPRDAAGVVELVGLEAGADLLDCPCGYGRHSIEFARLGLHATGADRSEVLLAEAKGRWVVVMDCDLQDAPEDIPALYAKAREGFDVVYALQDKVYASWLVRVLSGVYHALVAIGISGSGALDVNAVASPARLLIDGQQSSPSVITGSTGDVVMRVHVSACNGRPVQGALVYATAVPFRQFSVPPESPTGADGWATLTMHQQGGFPAAQRQQLLAVFLRARKSGENLLSGISTRRLVSFRVSLR